MTDHLGASGEELCGPSTGDAAQVGLWLDPDGGCQVSYANAVQAAAEEKP